MRTHFISTDKLFTNITDEIAGGVPEDFNGICLVYTPHTTASVALLEDELLHLVDIRFLLDSVVPKEKLLEGVHRNTKYLHDMISLRHDVGPEERPNGHSHLRTLFFSSHVAIPVIDGSLHLGLYKRVFFVELDPIRERTYTVSLIPTL